MRLRDLAGLLLLLFSCVVHAVSPDIALSDLDARPGNVNEYIGQGKWTVVVLWAHDCGVCGKEIHHMSAFHQTHQDKDAIVLGVSIDGLERIEQARGFVARHKLPFMNLVAEPDEAVILKFGGGRFVGTPTHYFYDPTGRIVGRKIGPIKGEDVEAFIKAVTESGYAKK